MGQALSDLFETRSKTVVEFEEKIGVIVKPLNTTETVQKKPTTVKKLSAKQILVQAMKNKNDSPKTRLFLRIPNEFLNPEQIKLQEDFAKSTVKNNENYIKLSERISINEIAFWHLFQKLAKNTVGYDVLWNAIVKKDFEKVSTILDHNKQFLEAIRNDSQNTKFEEQKNAPYLNFMFTPTTYELKGKVNLSCLLMENNQQGQASDTESEINSSESNENSAQEYSIINRDEPQNDHLEEKSRSTGNETESMQTMLNINKDSTKTISEATEKLVNHHDPVQTHASKINALLANMETTTTEVPKKSDCLKKQTEKRQKKEREEFGKMMKTLCERDKKENKALRKKIEKEMEQQLKKYREKMEEMEKIAKEKEEMEAKMAKAKSDKKEFEFQQSLEALRLKQQETLKKLREEREEIEREAEDALLQNLAEFEAKSKAFWTCALLKLKWEAQEKNWEDWLQVLKSAVARTKVMFMRIHRPQTFDNEDDLEDLRRELSYLCRQTESTHEMLYQAFFYLKKMSSEFPDSIFLRILMKNMKKASDKLLIALINTEKVNANEHTYDILNGIFDTFEPSDVLSTWKLREIAKTADFKDYEQIDDPLKVEDSQESSGPKIVEVQKEETPSEQQSSNLETSEDPTSSQENQSQQRETRV